MIINYKPRVLIGVALAGIGIGSAVQAAPSLPVTHPVVTPAELNNGPGMIDANAVMGQWFQSVATSNLAYRTREFHDNSVSNGGGAAGHLAIAGRVTNVVRVVFNLFQYRITSFDIVATVSNDTASTASGSWADGTNCYGEVRSTGASYSNTLCQAILTADFARAGLLPLPTVTLPQYRMPPGMFITATNHDQISWYGFNLQGGAYQVPGWTLGDIPPGGGTNLTLHFIVTEVNGASGDDIGIPDTELRYTVISDAESSGADIFINRSSSLKVGQWIIDPWTDDGSAYPVNDETNDASCVSVFHNTVDETNQVIAIRGCGLLTGISSSHVIMSMGCPGLPTNQVLQSCSSLTASNWTALATNKAWPLPQTNRWTNTSVVSSPLFYRIAQP